MGLFQSLEEAAGLGARPGQAAAAPGVLGAVIQMVRSQPGGIAGVIQKFEAAGLGGVVQSWLGASSNHPVDGGQVQSILGAGPVGQVAGQLDIPLGEAAGHIAQILPLILDHLSPNGQPPAGGAAAALEGLMMKFGL
jgi:uncharacterized protein YidB (DUF937 family)